MDCSARDFNTQNIHHYYYSAIAVSHLVKHPVPRPSLSPFQPFLKAFNFLFSLSDKPPFTLLLHGARNY
jgi:hypothetical protein